MINSEYVVRRAILLSTGSLYCLVNGKNGNGVYTNWSTYCSIASLFRLLHCGVFSHRLSVCPLHISELWHDCYTIRPNNRMLQKQFFSDIAMSY